ncbi:MAG: DUF1583 domain-containing protein, partial [Thermoguttaceae bacterium]
MIGRHPALPAMLVGLALCVPTFAGASTVLLWPVLLVGQQADDDPQQEIIERFLLILERNPRRGTALDRIYGHYVESGKLQQLLERYRKRTTDNAKDGTAWMILGLIESKQGNDAKAIEAFRQAETHAQNDPALKNLLASYYLGQALTLTGQADEAAEALERAIDRKPQPADLLEIFQALGRLHQRAGHNQQAIEVFNRLEKLFPDDQRVQEQIAVTLAEEEQYEEALKRYVTLAEKTTGDLYRRVHYRIEAANIRLRLGKKQEAIADFEALLGQLKPDSWLFRMVRQSIEQSYQREEDLAGLSAYYERWIEKHPEDVDAMTRAARTLAMQGRSAEARTWFDRAIRLAPKQTELRLALIDQLVYERKYREAIEQYAELDKTDKNNPDNVRQWGLLILKDKSLPAADRKRRAAAVWKRLTEARPGDALTATRVADLLREAELTDEALALYRKAVELAPDEPQYHEYLGQFYHSLDRPEEAVAAWQEIAAGKRRTAEYLNRLAEVLDGFGYPDEAIRAVSEACRLDAEDFHTNLLYADLLSKAERFEDAIEQLRQVAGLADSFEQREIVLDRQIDNYRSAEQLEARTQALAAELQADKQPTAQRWCRLARYYQASDDLLRATAVVRKAIAVDEGSIAAWRLAAKLFESNGSLVEAADAQRKLTTIDRAFRTQYFKELAGIETRLGRTDEALQAGRDLIASAPGSPEHYQFFAELCFRLGKTDDALDALRRAVRSNPSDAEHLLTLAGALARQFMTADAIELYWQALEKMDAIQGKITIISHLTELHLQTGQFDRLLARLQRMRRQGNRRRETTFCIAQVHLVAQDYTTAREELESLLAENDRDTYLMQQLSSLAEQEGDFETAIKYQRQLNEITSESQGKRRLAQLYLQAGRPEESEALWAELISDEDDPRRMLTSLDSLLAYSRFKTALAITERSLRQDPGNWELLYRRGVALAKSEQNDPARQCFQQILDLTLSDDEKGIKAKALASSRPGPLSLTTTTRSRTSVYSQQQQPSWLQRLSVSHEIRRAAELDSNYPYGYSSSPGRSRTSWGPGDFGQARMAALGWLLKLARQQDKEEEFLAKYENLDEAEANSRLLSDTLYLQLVNNRQDQIYETAKRLVRDGDLQSQQLYLYSLTMRSVQTNQVSYLGGIQQPADNTPPLSDDELDRMMGYYRNTDSQPGPYGSIGLSAVLTELKRAGRTEQEQAVYREAVEKAEEPMAVAAVLSLASARGDIDMVLDLMEKLATKSNASTPAGYSVRNMHYTLMQAMPKLAADEAYDKILHVFDRYVEMCLAETKKSTQASRQQNWRQVGSVQRYQVVSPSGSFQSIQLQYPTPNSYYDAGTISLLRSTYEIFDQADRLDEVATHFEQRLEQADNRQRVMLRLGLSYLYWWNDDQETAVENLRQAVELASDTNELAFELARIYTMLEDPQAALEVLDGIQTLNQSAVLRREMAVLTAASAVGETDRARKAAERLFGLQLRTEEQLQLVPQMQQLGLNEMAEAMLRRAQQRAGRNANQLVSIMIEYQRQDKLDLAVQVAHQILRRPPTPAMPGRPPNDTDSMRRQAMQVLTTSGKLDDLIERTEAQLARSPNSVQLMRTLADFYRMGNKNDKAREIYEKLTQLSPKNANLCYQLARMLSQANQRDLALQQYEQALKLDPAASSRYLPQILREFQQAKELPKLATILGEIDIRKFQDVYRLMSLMQMLVQQSETREVGMQFFDKVWEAFPDQRDRLLSSFPPNQLPNSKRFYDYARLAVLSTVTAYRGDPWAGTQVVSWSSSRLGPSKATSNISRLLDAAEGQDKFDELYAEIEQAMEKSPQWLTGNLVLILIEARRGNVDRVKTLLAELLREDAVPMSWYAQIIVGQEIESIESLQPLAMQMYEQGLKHPDPRAQTNYALGTAIRLVALLRKADRKADARKVVLQYLDGSTINHPDPAYAAYQRLRESVPIAKELRALGYPLDAFRVCCEVTGDKVVSAAAQRYGSSQRYQQQIDQELQMARAMLTPEVVLRALPEMLQRDDTGKMDRTAMALMTLAEPTKSNETVLSSPIAEALAKAAKTPEVLQETKAAIRQLAENRPEDFSVQVVATLHAIHLETGEARLQAVQRLVELADRNPLEPLTPGKKLWSKERRAAAEQLGLWLVARLCLTDDALRPLGEKLAARAADAARRQSKPELALAMSREMGQWALDRGDLAAADLAWRQLLEAWLGRAIGSREPAVSATPPKDRPKTIRPVSIATFKQAVELAKLAAENDLPELSLDCVRESLRGGPPNSIKTSTGGSTLPTALVAVAASRYTVPRVIALQPTTQKATSYEGAVCRSVTTVDQLWKKHRIPPEKVYDALLGIVLPEHRPESVFVYADRLTLNSTTPPRSIGALLVSWAVDAGRTDELRRQLESRREKPTTEASARMLEARLGVAVGDAELTAEMLDWFAERLKTTTSQQTSEMATHAAMPALQQGVAVANAVTVLDQIAGRLNIDTSGELAGNLRMMLIRRSLEHGEFDHCVAQLRTYREMILKQSGSASRSLYLHQLLGVGMGLAQLGETADALAVLGDFVDVKFKKTSLQNPSPLALLIVQQMAARPAGDRYTLLKSWILPTADHQSVREVSFFAPTECPPTAFLQSKPTAASAGAWPRSAGFVSFSELLIESARQAGKLEELHAAVKAAVGRELPGADTLEILVSIARAEVVEIPELEKRLAEVQQEAPTVQSRREMIAWPYLVARASTAHETLWPSGERLVDVLWRRATGTQNWALAAHLVRDRNAGLAGRHGDRDLATRRGSGLTLWDPVCLHPAAVNLKGRPWAWWTARQGHVMHLCGTEVDYLFFAYPLVGEFEFSCDTYYSSWQEASLAYGGVLYDPNTAFSSVFLYSGRDRIERAGRVRRDSRNNRLTVQVRPERVRYLCNGHLIYEEQEPTRQSPWLALMASAARQAVWCNLRITGNPEIPRQVDMVQEGRLDGWSSLLYGEGLPTRLKVDRRLVESPLKTLLSSSGYDWLAREGTLYGRHVADSSDTVQSTINYDRPLRSGETVSYEFLYEPNEKTAHPSLGRIAFLLEPDGVKLHWITDKPSSEVGGLLPDNAIVAAEERRGPEQLPLKPGQWNTMSVSLQDEVVTLRLNDEEIYRRQFEPENSRLFGLFHYKDRSAVEVRKLVLTGDWPEKLPPELFDDLTACAVPGESAETRSARAALIGEEYFSRNADAVVRRARELPPQQRYEDLLAWVFPKDTPGTIRLYGDFSQLDPPPPVKPTDRGGVLQAPALELVEVARQLGKLDALASWVDASVPDEEHSRRGKLALLALIQMSQGQEKEATLALDQLRSLASDVPASAGKWQRWPEFVAASVALEHPEMLSVAEDLLEDLAQKQFTAGAITGPMGHHVRRALARARLAQLVRDKTAKVVVDPPLKWWSPTFFDAMLCRGEGWPEPLWALIDGELRHQAGHRIDFSFFNVPLMGNFEVTCELTSFGHREMFLSYAGSALHFALSPQDDHRQCDVWIYEHFVKKADIDPPLAKFGEWYTYRLVVQDRQLKIFVDGREIYQRALAEEHDPWLAIRT